MYFFTMKTPTKKHKDVKMNKLKLAFLVSFLVTEVVSAKSFASAKPCDGFQIRLRNTLADSLLITSIKLNGADIQPGTFEKLNSKSEQVFTINRSIGDGSMSGEFTLHTISVPYKTVRIYYTLENKSTFCEHTDHSPKGDYAVEKTRKIGEVQYSINNQ
jgi:hypothetical protein